MTSKRDRIHKLITRTALLLLIGGLYYLAVLYLGIGIRCPFERLTGYMCPGCGITRMVFAISRLDFKSAWQWNQLTFVLLPFYAVLAIYLGWQYVERGKTELPRWLEGLLWIIVAAYIIFGVWRNL